MPVRKSGQRALYGDMRLPSRPPRGAHASLADYEDEALELAGRARVPRVRTPRPARVRTRGPRPTRSAGGVRTLPTHTARPTTHTVSPRSGARGVRGAPAAARRVGRAMHAAGAHPRTAGSAEAHALFGGRPRRGRTAFSHNAPGKPDERWPVEVETHVEQLLKRHGYGYKPGLNTVLRPGGASRYQTRKQSQQDHYTGR